MFLVWTARRQEIVWLADMQLPALGPRNGVDAFLETPASATQYADIHGVLISLESTSVFQPQRRS